MAKFQEGSLDRRSFFRGAALVGGATAAIALTGCSGGGSPSSNAAPAASSDAPKSELSQDATVYDADALVKADAEWEEVYAFAEGDSAMIEGMNFHPTKANELWFIDIGMGRVMCLNTDTGELAKPIDKPGEHTPNGARLIDDDTILIADRNRGLCMFTISTGEYKNVECEFDLSNARWGQEMPDEKQGFDILNDLVLDDSGHGCYITDPGLSDYCNPTGRIWHVDYSDIKDGKAKASVWARGIKYCNGITISPDGNFLYVAEFNTNAIINIPTAKYCEGKVLDTPYVVAHLVGGHGPDGVITDAEGNIYCAHLHAKEVAVVDNQGRPVRNIGLPVAAGTDPSNLCLHDGYLYVCEFSKGVIWRIAIDAQPNPLA